MAKQTVTVPYSQFFDANGNPLENGQIYIGTSGLAPQSNPIAAYYDYALTIPVSQPLRTTNGYIYRNGSPAKIYVDAVDFSMVVLDSNGSQVYSQQTGNSIVPQDIGFPAFVANNYIRANAAGDAYESRTPSQVLSDIGGDKIKAFVEFNGIGTVSILASYNVSSITDNGVGDYTVNFTTNIPSNYVAVCDGDAQYTDLVTPYSAMKFDATGFNIRAYNAGSPVDSNKIHAVCFA